MKTSFAVFVVAVTAIGLFGQPKPHPLTPISRVENVPVVYPTGDSGAVLSPAFLYATVTAYPFPRQVGLTVPLKGLSGDTLYVGTNDAFGPTSFMLLYEAGSWRAHFYMVVDGGGATQSPLGLAQLPDSGPTDDPTNLTFTFRNVVWHVHQ